MVRGSEEESEGNGGGREGQEGCGGFREILRDSHSSMSFWSHS